MSTLPVPNTYLVGLLLVCLEAANADCLRDEKNYPLQRFRDIVKIVWVFTNFNHAAQVASCAKVLTANGAL